MPVSDALRRFARDLGEIFGERLQSVAAYGRHAPGRTRDHGGLRHEEGDADGAHTLAIVDRITRDDLQACARRVPAWHAAGLATPLLFAAREFERSLDAFPLELGAILADHEVVVGRDPFEKAAVLEADLRRGCEVQARSHLLHLREGVLETGGRADALSLLIVQSAAPFAALLQSVARLEGADVSDQGRVARHAERRLGLTDGVISRIVALAGASDLASDEATALFPGYLAAVEALVAYVDGWGRR
ncbi:MAG: hypothetical protein IT176_01810 [Acidobacteria bacterium]|nr:hypothetical protein [Acidobacteriota bacterium]